MRLTKEIRLLIGDQLKAARVEREETQATVAVRLGISRQMINRYEKGRDAPTAQNLARLMRYFGIPLDLPGFKLTAEALELEPKRDLPTAEQFTLPFGKERVFPGATVRVKRNRNSLEIYALIQQPRRRRNRL